MTGIEREDPDANVFLTKLFQRSLTRIAIDQHAGPHPVRGHEHRTGQQRFGESRVRREQHALVDVHDAEARGADDADAGGTGRRNRRCTPRRRVRTSTCFDRYGSRFR